MSSPSLSNATAETGLHYTCLDRTSSSCAGKLRYKDSKGKRYCVLHYPGADKKQAFEAEVKKKLESKDFNFEGVCFPEGWRFGNLDIEGPANFSRAVFNCDAYFSNTTFRSTASFEGAIFNDDSSFDRATFIGEVNFSKVIFQKDANFRNTKFAAYSNFWRCTFKGRAEFDYSVFGQTASFWPAIFESTASFSNAKFVRGNFRASEFKAKAVFTWCVFDRAEFTDAAFSQDADFFDARFVGDANFVSATFKALAQFRFSEFNGDTHFTSATFNGRTDFRHCIFKSIVGYSAEYGRGGFGRDAVCDFRHTRFEAPKRVSFHSMRLRPHWFINTDARDFQFTDVQWIGNLRRKLIAVEIGEIRQREEQEDKEAAQWRANYLKEMEAYGDQFTVERLKKEDEELVSTRADNIGQQRTRFNRLLATTCRQLAGNAEENHRYEEAAKFRYWAMDARRLEDWKGFAFWRLSWWYWLASGYGERVFRAFFCLLVVWLLFALLYTQVGFAPKIPRYPGESEDIVARRAEIGEPLDWSRATTYSLGVITLQKPEPRPVTVWAQRLVIFETILGPLQAALLALAIRRKFMR
jgi:hypothetical protein